MVKNPPAIAGDIRGTGSIPRSGRSPGGGNGRSLQYSCLGNPMDRGAWRATVHGVAERQTWLKWPSTHTATVWTTSLYYLDAHIYLHTFSSADYQINLPTQLTETSPPPGAGAGGKHTHTLVTEQQELLWTRKCVTCKVNFPSSILTVTRLFFYNQMNYIKNLIDKYSQMNQRSPKPKMQH